MNIEAAAELRQALTELDYLMGAVKAACHVAGVDPYVAVDTAGRARPEPAEGDQEPRPRRREPKLLGVPVDSIRGRR